MSVAVNMEPSKKPETVALIAGPTASGKSALALRLAEMTGGIIINADASQVYKDLRIVSARPSAEEESRAPHRLFGHLDGATAYSAAQWAAEAKAVTVPLVTANSKASRPLTLSLKEALTTKGAVTLVGEVDSTTAGGVVSAGA